MNVTSTGVTLYGVSVENVICAVYVPGCARRTESRSTATCADSPGASVTDVGDSDSHVTSARGRTTLVVTRQQLHAGLRLEVADRAADLVEPARAAEAVVRVVRVRQRRPRVRSRVVAPALVGQHRRVLDRAAGDEQLAVGDRRGTAQSSAGMSATWVHEPPSKRVRARSTTTESLVPPAQMIVRADAAARDPRRVLGVRRAVRPRVARRVVHLDVGRCRRCSSQPPTTYSLPSSTALPDAACGFGLSATVVQVSEPGSYAWVVATGSPFSSQPPTTYSWPLTQFEVGASRASAMSASFVQLVVLGS